MQPESLVCAQRTMRERRYREPVYKRRRFAALPVLASLFRGNHSRARRGSGNYTGVVRIGP